MSYADIERVLDLRTITAIERSKSTRVDDMSPQQRAGLLRTGGRIAAGIARNITVGLGDQGPEVRLCGVSMPREPLNRRGINPQRVGVYEFVPDGDNHPNLKTARRNGLAIPVREQYDRRPRPQRIGHVVFPDEVVWGLEVENTSNEIVLLPGEEPTYFVDTSDGLHGRRRDESDGGFGKWEMVEAIDGAQEDAVYKKYDRVVTRDGVERVADSPEPRLILAAIGDAALEMRSIILS